MQQDNNNMDKKLKQLENQSLPDLSKMDEHWEKMKKDLVSGSSLPKTKTGNKKLIWVVAAAFTLLLFFVGYKFIFKKSERSIVQKNQPVNSTDTLPAPKIHYKVSSSNKDSLVLVQQKKQLSNDTVLIKAVTTEGKEVNLVATHVKSQPKKDTVTFKNNNRKKARTPILLKGKTTEGKDIEIIATPVTDTNTKKPAIDNKKAIQSFFAQIEKQGQSFVINNKRDTVIQGNEGTAILIPALAFGGDNSVTINMKEYYSYKDIITNRLTTVSNDKLLVTGGMLHLTASINGKEVDIQPGKSIRWFVPDTTNEIKQMQLFNGIVNNASLRRLTEDSDTAVVDYSDNINWISQSRYFSSNYLETRYKVLNLSNQPYKTRTTSKGLVGKFLISDKAKLSDDELKNQLKEKYGYYKVKIKGHVLDFSRRKRITTRQGKFSIYFNYNIGDSAWLTQSIVNLYNLKPTDTITYTVRGIGYTSGRYIHSGTMVLDLNKLTNRFSVDISSLGWINCDRFYDDYRPKIDYIVNLGDKASNYYTLLVFDNIKSMMSGFVSGNKVAFRNVPEGESAKIVSISIKDGKPVAAMQTVKLSRTVFEGLKFEETTPLEFREKAGSLDKP